MQKLYIEEIMTSAVQQSEQTGGELKQAQKTSILSKALTNIDSLVASILLHITKYG